MPSVVRHPRIVADDGGGSRYDAVEVSLRPVIYAPPAPAFDVSAPIAATAAVLYSAPPGWVGEWHPTPRVQLYVQLRGVLEVTTSDGEVRELGPGELVVLEDDTGTGHRSRVVGDEPSEGLFVHLVAGVGQAAPTSAVDHPSE